MEAPKPNDSAAAPAADGVAATHGEPTPPSTAATAAIAAAPAEQGQTQSQQQQPGQRQEELPGLPQAQPREQQRQPEHPPSHETHHQSSTADTSNAEALRRRKMMARDRYHQQSLGFTLNSAVKKARVLLVGAGGIGCELLKNLVLVGFGQIHVVDLDTIDVSNLNRQFLFRQEHLKKPKALVAKEVAGKFNPNVRIIAHHANIKESEFNVSWFRTFRLVFNALDNLDARRHVNRMCLAADVTLVESGTTGFNGQVQVIKKGTSACYDCYPKETPKSYPVCTIRSSPSQPIHCIVWAKDYLLNEMFGASEDDSAFDYSSDAHNAHEIEELRRESSELKKIRESMHSEEFPRLVFEKVFNQDIKRLQSVEGMWKTRRRPEALDYDSLSLQASEAFGRKDRILREDQRVWSIEDNLVVFVDSLNRLSKRLLSLRATKSSPVIPFDKDDDDTLDFVASSANIRSEIFGIQQKSRFVMKQMAGNIIPAIATTNAIVAGLCVLESFKILKDDMDQAKEVFLTPFASARLLAPDKLQPPNPECPVCSVFNTSITADLSRVTLNDVVEDVVKGKLGFGDREFAVCNEVGVLYDADETENLDKKLCDLGIKGSSFLTIVDESEEDALVNVVIDVQEQISGDQELGIETALVEGFAIPRKPQKALDAKTNGDESLNGNGTATAMSEELHRGVKRPHQEDSGEPTKKAKRDAASVEEAIVVDGTDGAIVISDD